MSEMDVDSEAGRLLGASRSWLDNGAMVTCLALIASLTMFAFLIALFWATNQ